MSETVPANKPAIDLSVVVITLNEEENIDRCLASLPRGAEVVVVDSESTDRTLEKALASGANVQRRRFDSYGSQKNVAIAMASRSWIISIDADEVMDAQLREGLIRFCRKSQVEPRKDAYHVRRRLVFMGRTMRFGKSCDQPVRLFRNGSGQFGGNIHERFVLERGEIGRFRRGSLEHHSYKNLSDYFTRFNRYTTTVAADHRAKGHFISFGIVHYLRPWSEFISRYFLRLGFLDGYPGYCYALVSSLYAFIKYAKLRELTEAPTDRL